jgi:lysophospholipase L1-like esterase
MKEANRLIQDFAATQEHVQYIDVASAMFDSKGNLRAYLFVEDGLHPNPKCYALWTSIIKPLLVERVGLKSQKSQVISKRRCHPAG